jgi:hypothetical protein
VTVGRHLWEGEEFGPVEHYWYLEREYCLNIQFPLDQRPFIAFCKERGISPHELTMKIAYRLSLKYLPQYVVALNKKAYPARYPAGYIRKVHPDKDMLEWVAVREKEIYFAERRVRDHLSPGQRYLMVHFPRLAIFLAKHFFGRHEVKGQYALMVSRNPMPEVGFPITFHGTHYRTFVLILPYGGEVQAWFGGPHAFANIDYYKGLICDFKNYIEHPETIPQELIDKRYDPEPLGPR